MNSVSPKGKSIIFFESWQRFLLRICVQTTWIFCSELGLCRDFNSVKDFKLAKLEIECFPANNILPGLQSIARVSFRCCSGAQRNSVLSKYKTVQWSSYEKKNYHFDQNCHYWKISRNTEDTILTLLLWHVFPSDTLFVSPRKNFLKLQKEINVQMSKQTYH